MSKIILFLLKPFVKFIGKLHLPFTVKKVDGKFYHYIRKRMTPGCIVLTCTNGQFSNLINPAKWNHAALYLGQSEQGEHLVIESLGEGVIVSDLVSHLTTKDKVLILKPKFPVNESDLFKVSSELLGVPYDYFIDERNSKFYCYELAVVILKKVSGWVPKITDSFLGHRFYSEKTFLKSSSFEVLDDSDSFYIRGEL